MIPASLWMLLGLPFLLAGAAASAWGAPASRPATQSSPEQGLPELTYPAYFSDLDKAKAQVFHGRYLTALASLERISGADPCDLALTRAAALAALGRADEAMRILTDPVFADRSAVQIARARMLNDLGRLDEARALLRQHLEQNPDSLAGHFYLGQVCEAAGDLVSARQAYGWIHTRFYDRWIGQGFREFEDAEQVTLMGRAFDRYATLTGAYANNAPLHNLILRVFVQAYDMIDRSYWPAHLAAAEFYWERSNPNEARTELKAVLAANPNELRAHRLLGLISLQEWNFDGADQAIAAIRRVNPAAVEADLLECRTLLQQRRPDDAQVAIRRVLQRRPANLEALGLLAASYALQLQDQKVEHVLAQVHELDPDNASAYFEIAEQLAALRQYSRAEQMYEKAIERAPWWMAPRNGLGLLLTQSGNEEKARIVLDGAYSLDPFNFRTTNYLILLDKLAKLARRETDHFIILYDPEQHSILADYFSEYLEGIHTEICAAFKHEPPLKTLVEIFPTHEAFSVRTTGSPWIGTVGASTGRVIALVAPHRGPRTLGPYNFAQVLRHEYTHTVTLSATENRIAHWLTEGLAVSQENAPLRWEWIPMLYKAVNERALLSLEDLTRAFIRPRGPQERTLAYAQSYWICCFIREKFGNDHIFRMMALFRDARTLEEVFRQALNMTPERFSAEFLAWAETQVRGWGYDEQTSKQADELVREAEKATQARDYSRALVKWQELLKLRPMDQLPHQRLAGLYLTAGVRDPRKAAQHLLRLHEASLKDNRFGKRLARLCLEELNDLPGAQKYALEAVFVDPYDIDAHELLASIYEKNEDQRSLAREKRAIAFLHEWVRRSREGEPVSPADKSF